MNEFNGQFGISWREREDNVSVLSYLQRVGRALMVPVATLPAAAILMGIGYWIDPNGWGSESALAALLIKSGAAIIENMGVLFAVGIAYGMSKDKDGAAALTGFVGFLVLTTLCSPAAVSMIQHIPLAEVPAAFSKIQNQFIGILVGIISAELYNRYSHVKLPEAFSFFSGRRLVPILTSFLMIVVAFILMYVWPVIFGALVTLGEHIQQLGSLGAGGKANLVGIDACITRLRLNVVDSAQVDEALAKRLGAAGVICLNKQNVQIVVGTQAEAIATALKQIQNEQ